MTAALEVSTPLAASRSRWLECDTRGQALLTGAAMFLFLVMIQTLLAMAIEVRTLNGINVWIKPVKFEFFVAIHF